MSGGYQLRSRGESSSMPEKNNSTVGKPTHKVDDNATTSANSNQVQGTSNNNDVIIAAIRESEARINQRLESSNTNINERLMRIENSQKESLQLLGNRVEAIELVQKVAGGKITDMKTDIQKLQDDVKELNNIKTSYYAQIENAKKQAIRDELYAKRFNLIADGLPQTEVWETRNQSLEIVEDFLRNRLNIEPGQVHINDVHRLHKRGFQNRPRRGRRDENRAPAATLKPLPMIIQFGSILQRNHVLDKVRDILIPFNKDVSNVDQNKIYVNRHIPKKLRIDKKQLLDRYRKEREAKKDVEWYLDIENASMCLKVNGVVIQPLCSD